MLRSLKIRHFKSIYSSELKFGRANLFIGANGAGKSNVLEAIGVLAGALSRGIDPTSLDERGIRLSLPTLFKSAFKKTRIQPTFRLEATFDHGRYECSIRAGLSRANLEFHSEALYDDDIKVFGRGPNGINLNRMAIADFNIRSEFVDPTRGLWDILAPIAKISDEFRAELDEFSDFSIYAPQTAVMRGVAVDPRVKSPLGLTGAGLALAFHQAISDRSKAVGQSPAIDKILKMVWQPGWADNIRIGNFDSSVVPSNVKSDGLLLYIRDRFMNTNRNYLSAFDASEGTLYLIFVATLLAHQKTPRVLALDNVDGTLNSRLVRHLTDTLVDVCCTAPVEHDSKPIERQVFVTSHHPSSLDSFDVYESKQAIFVAHRELNTMMARGSTKFDRLLPPEGLARKEWYERGDGKNLSIMMLEGIIPDAL